MTPLLIVAAVLLIAAGVTVIVRRRSGGGGLEGVQGFRRHMDALSSEARRDVIGRLQTPDDDDRPMEQSSTIAGQPGVGGRMNPTMSDPTTETFDHEAAPAAQMAEEQQSNQHSNGEGTAEGMGNKG